MSSLGNIFKALTETISAAAAMVLSGQRQNWAAVLVEKAVASAETAAPAGSLLRVELRSEFVKILGRYLNEQILQAAKAMAKQRFWWVNSGGQRIFVYDRDSKLLWEARPDPQEKSLLRDASKVASERSTGGLSAWRLPTEAEITKFSGDRANPLRAGRNARLLDEYAWCTSKCRIDLDDFSTRYSEQESGAIVACNDFAANAGLEEFIVAAVGRQWQVFACGVDNAENVIGPVDSKNLQAVYREIDNIPVRLPVLDAAQFTDPHKGLWEFWGMDPQWLVAHSVRARNPALDVRDCNVAIDFGTSSTVVAYDDNDQLKLLRIGVGDYWEQERPAHYENPTVLEFIDIRALLRSWQERAYRPGVEWQHVRCSHAALQNFRDNKSNPRVVGSILVKLKHWALREADKGSLRLRDRSGPVGVEYEVAPLTQREPVKGQPLTVDSQDPLDPIELYAWFLGMTINWRGRGLFLRYYMTFPVAYPRQVKDRILASFRRGLQRSLPATLVDQPVFQSFSVEERASEPAAYAACAMRALGIQATHKGVAYAVFDFGGGTTDFDFGYYRLPDADEEDQGKEQVFEHFGAAGDQLLGGENLLENMCYMVFRHNLNVCRENRIAFTRPMGAEDFAGSEMFLEQTQAASTNTVMLMARLRPLWEEGGLGANSTGMETIDLLDRDGGKRPCQLAVPVDQLKAYLAQRIEQGVRNFLAALKNAFAERRPDHVHVLLAGNASRSRWVLDCFGLPGGSGDASTAERVGHYTESLFDGNPPTLTVHEPLAAQEANLFHPTAKTGVALGLLQLCPGGSVKVINRALQYASDEAPFAHHVGRVRQGTFQAGLLQGAVYRRWHELGVPSERVFNLYHTQSPRAASGQVQQGESGLYKKRLDLASEVKGHKVFAQAVGPSEIEICTAVSTVAIEQGDFENMMTIALEG